MESNKQFLEVQTPSVRRGILEGCISASFATHLRAKATEETPLDKCLEILEKFFLDKNPIWARRKVWFDCHQREDEWVSQWWDCKVEISKDCDLGKMTTDEICLLQFMLGIHKKEKKLKEEMLRIKEPKLDDLLVLAQNWEWSENLAKELSNNVEARLVVADDDTESDNEGDELVDVKKISTYKKDKSNKWKEKFGDQSQQQRKEFETKQAIGEGAVPAAGREHPPPHKKCHRCRGKFADHEPNKFGINCKGCNYCKRYGHHEAI